MVASSDDGCRRAAIASIVRMNEVIVAEIPTGDSERFLLTPGFEFPDKWTGRFGSNAPDGRILEHLQARRQIPVLKLLLHKEIVN